MSRRGWLARFVFIIGTAIAAFYLFNLFGRPILHGVILDHDNKPIQNVDCQMFVTGHFGQMSTEGQVVGTTKTDTNGKFWFRAVEGAGYYFKKEGYYPYMDYGNVFYQQLAALWRKDHPENNPFIVHLYKIGTLAKLVRYDNAYIFLNKTNVTTGFDLYADGPSHGSIGERFLEPCNTLTTKPTLLLETWPDPAYNSSTEIEDGYHQWNLRMTIPGGGFALRPDGFSFMAPLNGYQESMVITCPGSLGDREFTDSSKLFFFKSSNGIYGRFKITLGPASEQRHQKEGDIVEVYLTNITVNETGSRNLESDDGTGN